MSEEYTTPISDLQIDALAGYCQETTARRSADAADFCFELFRRAFDLADNSAWDAIVTQYHRLVCSWVRKVDTTRLSENEVGNLAHQAIARFWQAISPKVPQLADSFGHSAELLRYLNRCTQSILHNHWRQKNRQDRIATTLIERTQSDASSGTTPVEDRLAEQQIIDQHVDQLQSWLRQHVQDPQEQRFLDLHYALGLSPREIALYAPDEFSDSATVRRIKERILKRARRSMLLQQI